MAAKWSAAQILAKLAAVRELSEKVGALTLSPDAREMWAGVLKREWVLLERMIAERMSADINKGNP